MSSILFSSLEVCSLDDQRMMLTVDDTWVFGLHRSKEKSLYSPSLMSGKILWVCDGRVVTSFSQLVLLM